MNEANQNANSFDAESLWHDGGDRLPRQNETDKSLASNCNLEQLSDSIPALESDTTIEESGSVTAKMDWQRVAHKLREYNRRLLKKVFRLEQELAEIDNKYNKSVEKSKNSDMLLVQQAKELESDREKQAVMVEQLANSQQQLDDRELIIKQISEQHELSQQQAAQLERECTLLQEKYNQKAFELVAKEKENQELQSELSQQQHTVLQLEAQLKRYQEAASRKEKAASRNQNYPHNRFIQPWSNSTIPEPKIALPKTKSATKSAMQPTVGQSTDRRRGVFAPPPIQPTIPKKTASNIDPIKTAAEIATWSASAAAAKKVERTTVDPATTAKAKTQQSKKPQSLASVDLPTFPRPQ